MESSFFDPSTPSLVIKCKIKGSDDLRRRTIPLNDSQTLLFAQLQSVVAALFKLDRGPAGFKIHWKDEDNDLVTIDCDEDVDECVRSSRFAPKPVLHFEILPVEHCSVEAAETEAARIKAEETEAEAARVAVGEEEEGEMARVAAATQEEVAEMAVGEEAEAQAPRVAADLVENTRIAKTAHGGPLASAAAEEDMQQPSEVDATAEAEKEAPHTSSADEEVKTALVAAVEAEAGREQRGAGSQHGHHQADLAAEVPSVFENCRDLSLSCIADIEASLVPEGSDAASARLAAPDCPSPTIDLTSSSAVASNQQPVDTTLPVGWEQMLDEKNQRIYYVDHTTRTTHWVRPQVIQQSKVPAVGAAAETKPPSPPPAVTQTVHPNPNVILTEWQPAFDSMVGMGFAPAVVAQTLLACDGNADDAIEAALSHSPQLEPEAALVAMHGVAAPPTKGITIFDEIDLISAAQPPIFPGEWEALLPELAEMGFQDHDANRALLAVNHGDLKKTVTTLVATEREQRKNRR